MQRQAWGQLNTKSFFIKIKQSWIKENSLVESTNKTRCSKYLRSYSFRNMCIYFGSNILWLSSHLWSNGREEANTCGRIRRPWQESLINKSKWFPILTSLCEVEGFFFGGVETFPRGYLITGIIPHIPLLNHNSCGCLHETCARSSSSNSP